MNNCFLVDWFSATCKLETYSQVFDILGIDLEQNPFTSKRNGIHGFRTGLYMGGISIYFDNATDPSLVWVEMSGSGCRTFETVSSKSFLDLFRLCYPKSKRDKPFFHLSRLDIAYDIYTDPFLLDRMKYARDCSCIVSALGSSQLVEDINLNAGAPIEYTYRCLYFGSMKSELMFRLYDKRLERQRSDIPSWYRLEMQLRNDKAIEFTLNYCKFVLDDESLTIGNIFCSYLDKYLSVRERGSDSNARRWRVADWWSEFIKGSMKLHQLEKKETSYNMLGVMSFVQRQCGNSIDVLVQTIGIDGLLKLVSERSSELSPEQLALINDYHIMESGQNEWSGNV